MKMKSAASISSSSSSTATNKPNVSAILPSQHADYVSAIAFDHYGRRIATCSADRQVHIWDLDDSGQWVLGTSITAAHYSGVAGVSWSHPEFGQLLVTGILYIIILFQFLFYCGFLHYSHFF